MSNLFEIIREDKDNTEIEVTWFASNAGTKIPWTSNGGIDFDEV